MTSSNWLELSILLLIAVIGLVLWRLIKGKFRRSDGFEGIIVERGKQPVRNKLDIEDEIEHLESILNRK